MSNSELHSGILRQPTIGGANLDNIRGSMRRPASVSGHGKKSRKSWPTEMEASPGASKRGGIRRPREADPCQHPFLNQLQGEMRRANRTNCPLSMVLFRLDGVRESRGNMKRFYELVRANRREIDIPAELGDLVAILLPETNEEGANAFARKILAHAADLRVSAIAQAYPGHLFDNLLSGERPLPDPGRFAANDSPTPQRSNSIPKALSSAKARWLGKLRLALD